MEYRRICRHSIQGFAGTPNQGKRTTNAGYVIVVLNGSDYYEVYLVKGMDVECVNSEVCFDELGGVIDRAIESGTDKAEYDKFCEQERQNLYVTVVTV